MALTFLILLVVGGSALIAAYRDFATMKIPNWISLFLIGSFFVLLPFTWQGMSVLFEHLAVGGTMFLIGFVMFALGWLGGGDAKLMAATSLWWVWPDFILYIMYTTLAGGAMAGVILLTRNFAPVSVVTHPWLYNFLSKDDHMPYGVALGVGTLATLPQSNIFLSAIGLG